MRPQRHYNLERLTIGELDNKRIDIIECIKSAKSIESREGYEGQLKVLEKIYAQKKQLVLNFKDHAQS